MARPKLRTVSIRRANDFDFHLAHDRGGLAIGADLKVVLERGKRALILDSN
jgi:hypothetical protein